VNNAHQANATLGRRLALCRDREFCEQPAAFHVWPRAARPQRCGASEVGGFQNECGAPLW